MTCDRAREALWPDPAAAADPAARAHYAGCASCQRFFRWQARLGRRLGGLRPAQASFALRGRLRLALARADRSRRRRFLWATLGAAAALVLAVVLLEPGSPTAPFAPAAARLAAQPMDSLGADRASASAWLSERLAAPLLLPDIEGAEFMGADTVLVGGALWGGARYRYKGMTVAYFARAADVPSPDSSMAADQVGRWTLVLWEEPGGPRALAGERPLTPDEVLLMARECRAKAVAVPPARS